MFMAFSNLHAIHLSKASVLSRRWMYTILTEKCYESSYRTIYLNEFETFVQQSFEEGQPPIQCFAWEPEDTILCLILVKPPFKICQIVEHPQWKYDPYSAIDLKQALLAKSCELGLTIDFTRLYEYNPRYRLEWTFHEK